MRFLALFSLTALAEMMTFFWVGSKIGLMWALGLALATALIGSFLVRRAGLSVLGSIRRKISEGVLPGRELSHGAAILVSGAFLISPGFITDVLGFLLLAPRVRDLIHGFISKRFSARMTVFGADRQTRIRGWRDATRPADDPGDDVIDVEGWE